MPEATAFQMLSRSLEFLRSNANFRRLWVGQLLSQIGDWFYSVAVYEMILSSAGARGVSYAIIIQTLPRFFMTPLAGHLADRIRRQHVMILADVVRGFVVLGFLGVHTPSQLWLAYVLLCIEAIFTSLFEPARMAILPAVVTPETILPANALSQAAWSCALGLGAGLGGLVTAFFGRSSVFVINSASYFASAFLAHKIDVTEQYNASREEGFLRTLREGARYLRDRPKVAVLVLPKTVLGIILGGAMLLLVVCGVRVFPAAGSGSLAVGLLYSGRGFGTLLGPLLCYYFTRSREPRMMRSISIGLIVLGLGYVGLGRAPTLLLGFVAVMVAHIGGSIVWTMATSLLQLNVPDSLQGRVFAVDQGLHWLSFATSTYMVGVGLDFLHIAPRALATRLGLIELVVGVLWVLRAKAAANPQHRP